MPSFIKQLDDKVINQIAAGEVIEGPSAALKEILENSLDAGALAVTVAVETGGKTLLRVTDDGIGMSREDLTMAFKRHSTSKIISSEDLLSVATLGFRGEALASIASVSRMETLSKAHGAIEGWKLVIEGAVEQELEPAGCAEGTSITVRDIFYNTPARKKFLKSDKREADKCFAVFRGLAISKAQVEWKYYQDGRLKIHLPPADLKTRITGIMGRKNTEGLEEVDFSEGGYSITGFAGDKGHTRRTRESQFIYLNGRKITDRKLSFFIANAYENMVGSGEFPSYFLFLEMDPLKVDINVHPAKTEVRFQREYEVFSFVKRAVRRSLGIESVINFQPRPPGFHHQGNRFPGRQISISVDQYGALFEKPADFQPPGATGNISFNPDNPPAASHDHYLPSVLFQLHNKYIVAQIKSGLALIDQHAAHERVLFEKALASISAGRANSQGLLITLQFEISAGEEDLFEELLPRLLQMGFEIKLFGPHSYLIEAVPAGVKISDELGLVREIFDFYRETEEKWVDTGEKAAASFACKAAIKTGHELSPDEMVTLIEALFRTGTPYACPHGRPTYIRMEISELDRRFGRTS